MQTAAFALYPSFQPGRFSHWKKTLFPIFILISQNITKTKTTINNQITPGPNQFHPGFWDDLWQPSSATAYLPAPWPITFSFCSSRRSKIPIGWGCALPPLMSNSPFETLHNKHSGNNCFVWYDDQSESVARPTMEREMIDHCKASWTARQWRRTIVKQCRNIKAGGEGKWGCNFLHSVAIQRTLHYIRSKEHHSSGPWHFLAKCGLRTVGGLKAFERGSLNRPACSKLNELNC